MGRKYGHPREYQTLGICRSCNEWRKLDQQGRCLHCDCCATGELARRDESDEIELREPTTTKVVFS
jgi:hypothetical protein